MATHVPEAEKREHVRKLIADFETAMLVTRTPEGAVRARPLSIAEKTGDGVLYFSTAIESGKVHDLEHDGHAAVVMQSTGRYLSLSGDAHIQRDRALIQQLWSESWRVWFPEGPSDPSLCLVVFEPHEADYWDAAGAAGLKYLFEMAKAYVTNTRPGSDGDERHTGHVKL
ncbi:MAG TPA: pyridoxamine 5'-phosphate oxidase family protein [Polyangia bacterium]|nr:pyridoxamine 5'-phosphate oxidase family protein [Polyangia bacterium]